MSVIDRPRYSPLRLVLVGLGIVGLAVALASPAALEPLTRAIEAAVEIVEHDWLIVAALGVVAVLVAATLLLSGRGAKMHQTEMPTVERPVPVAAAGDPFDETVGGWRFMLPFVGRSTREDIRERLRSTAVLAVAADEGIARVEARRRVDQGRWTDDRVATEFLDGARTGLGEWVVALANGETGPEYRARRTVEAILERRQPAATGGGSE